MVSIALCVRCTLARIGHENIFFDIYESIRFFYIGVRTFVIIMLLLSF
jgi:hypothetical protein